MRITFFKRYFGIISEYIYGTSEDVQNGEKFVECIHI